MVGQTELLVIAYQGEPSAARAVDVLQALHHEHIVKLENVAILTRDAQGDTHIHEANDPTSAEGALLGALIGGIIGIVKDQPIKGAALGAAGGFLASKLLDLGFDDPTLRVIADNLTPDSSALVAAIEFRDVEAAARHLVPLGGTILRSTLPSAQSAQLEAALQQSETRIGVE